MKPSEKILIDDLRGRAEKRLRESNTENKRALKKGETQAVIYELELRQIELEMQNEELQQTHTALEKSQDKYRDLYDCAPVGYLTFDEQGLILEVNRTAATLLNSEVDSLIDRRFQLFVTMDSRAIFSSFCRRVMEANDNQACELQLLSDQQNQTAVRIEGIAVHSEGGAGKQIRAAMIEINKNKTVSIQALQADISWRKQMEAALVAEKQRLAVTLSSIGDGVITTGMDGKVVLINKVAEQLTGWREQEAVGQLLSEVFHIIDKKTRVRCEGPVVRVLRAGEGIGFLHPTVLISRQGVEWDIDDVGAPIREQEGKIIGVVIVFRDVTDKLKMEEEHLRTSKLEALGLLAGGISHDFNNLLTAIMGNISLVMASIGSENPLFKRLEDAEKASLRARDLSKQFLTFAKGGAPIKKITSMANLLRNSTLFALGGSNVRCDFVLPETLWTAQADEGQISQVIHNLVLNAQQAMPEGGILRVEAENWNKEAGLEKRFPLRPGPYLRISIQDSGIGIPKENLERTFDPYFSTKQKGSGLGLSSAYSIIKKHDGYITVGSERGKGSIFTFYLPASPGALPAEAETKERPMGSRGGKILIMDDEEIVRTTGARLIGHLGYKVEEARDGAEAIERYLEAKAAGRPYDAVIMDLTVAGGIGGKEAIRLLLIIDPKVKAIVSSGYSNDPVMADYAKHGFRAVIAKPYQLEELNKVLHQVMIADKS